MSLSAIRDEIETILGGVSGMGTVHDYERWANNWSDFLTLYQDDNDRINGWSITRRKTEETIELV